MMVNCPKCGFSQPQDQYCASCGVDMLTFKPAQKSFLIRMATNTLLQMAVVSITIFVVFAYVRERDHKNNLARLELAEKSERFAQQREERRLREQEEAAVAQATTEEKPAADPVPEPQQAAASFAAKPIPVVPSVPPAVSNMEAIKEKFRIKDSTANAAASKTATTVRITFIEAQRSLVNDLIGSAAQVAIAGTVSAGVVPAIQTRLQSARTENAWRSLDSSPFQPLKANQPNIIFKGVRDPGSGQNLGFTVQVTPGAPEE
jgi:hypothetical protein